MKFRQRGLFVLVAGCGFLRPSASLREAFMRLRELVVLATVCSAAALAVFLLALWLVPRMTERVF
jgi:hypothetical protein